MIQGILGRKLGMTRLFDATGAATATTIVEVGPCFVTQIKTFSDDGYEAVQLGFEQVRPNKLTSPQRGHLNQAVAGRAATSRCAAAHSDRCRGGQVCALTWPEAGEP